MEKEEEEEWGELKMDLSREGNFTLADEQH